MSENKDGSVLKSRIKNGQGMNPPKDGAVCSGRCSSCLYMYRYRVKQNRKTPFGN